MPRGWKLFWTIIGSAVAAVAVVIALLEANPATQQKAATSPVAGSSPVPRISASASSQAGKVAPVVSSLASAPHVMLLIAELVSKVYRLGRTRPRPSR